MQEKIPCRRYSTQNYGGELFIETQRTTARNVMYVRGRVKQIEGRRCP
jgi:hypothetical protein